MFGLFFFMYERERDLLRTAETEAELANAEATALTAHPWFAKVAAHHRQELEYTLKEWQPRQDPVIYLDVEAAIGESLQWFQLMGECVPETANFLGLVLNIHGRKVVELENLALREMVKNLIIQAETRKRTASDSNHSKALQGKDAQIALQHLQAAETTQNLNRIIHSLESRSLEASTAIRQLRRHSQAAINWDEFKVYLQELHPNFLPTLWARHPELSEREIKVCILVRLGLQSKEIAALTRLSTKSVEIYRYRIRKKMKLTRSDSLVQYLSTHFSGV